MTIDTENEFMKLFEPFMPINTENQIIELWASIASLTFYLNIFAPYNLPDDKAQSFEEERKKFVHRFLKDKFPTKIKDLEVKGDN